MGMGGIGNAFDGIGAFARARLDDVAGAVETAAPQVGGFFVGAGETLWETGAGIVELGAGVARTAYDIGPAGVLADGATRLYEGATGQDVEAPAWMPSAGRGVERLEAAAEVVGAIVEDPGLLVDAVVDPIRDDWNNGNYGEAVGRGVAELLLAVVGTKGVDKAGKAARVSGAADDVADAARVGNRVDDLAATRHGLSQSQLDEIVAVDKGLRPDPASYLSPSYISSHLAQFEGGATRFMTESNLGKYGIGQRDGTSFVMPRHEADNLLAATGGDLRRLEEALGLPENFLDSNRLVRVDIPEPQELNLRMPSGNEAGANDLWIPGGKLPNGNSEAVVDVAGIPASRYEATPLQ
jgi:hypothetical protein